MKLKQTFVISFPVLSAGYDGDDNDEPTNSPFRNGSSFEDTPILKPEDVLGGMKTPPSVLTIDHGANRFGYTK